MDEIKFWLPFIVNIIATVVTLTLAFASLRQKIAVSDATNEGRFKNIEEKIAISDIATGDKLKNVEEKLGTKIDVLAKDVREVKDNHLHDLKDCVEKLSKAFTDHLITHGKKE